MAVQTAPQTSIRDTPMAREQRLAVETYQRATDAVLKVCRSQSGPWPTKDLIKAVSEDSGMIVDDVLKGLWRLTSEGVLKFNGNLTTVLKGTLP